MKTQKWKLGIIAIAALALAIGCGEGGDEHAGHDHGDGEGEHSHGEGDGHDHDGEGHDKEGEGTGHDKDGDGDKGHGEAMASKAADAKPYTLDVCIVSGEKLDSMGGPVAKVHEGQEVKFCCKSCVPDFDKEPAKYLTKLTK